MTTRVPRLNTQQNTHQNTQHDTLNHNTNQLSTLGYKPARLSDTWQLYFGREQCGCCLTCGCVIHMNRLVSRYSRIPLPWNVIRYLNPNDPNKHYVHFTPNLPLNWELDLEMIRLQVNGMTHRERANTLIPVCRDCVNPLISLNH
jgi:hypothetical protein